jgi:hypothetical protein
MDAVRVRAQDQFSGQGQPFFNQHLMADSSTDFEKIGNSLGPDELPDDAVILGMFCRWGRRSVIQENGVHLRVKYFCASHLAEYPDNGGGVVMG